MRLSRFGGGALPRAGHAPMPDCWASLRASSDGRRTGGAGRSPSRPARPSGFRRTPGPPSHRAYTFVVCVFLPDCTLPSPLHLRPLGAPASPSLRLFDHLPGELATRPKPPPDTIAGGAQTPPASRCPSYASTTSFLFLSSLPSLLYYPAF